MLNICKNCWSQCERDDTLLYEEEEFAEYLEEANDLETFDIRNIEYLDDYGPRSLCCLAPIITVDEEALETISNDIEENIFTFDDAHTKYGDLAFYIAENLVFVPGYDEP